MIHSSIEFDWDFEFRPKNQCWELQCGCAAGVNWSLVARAWRCSFCTAADSVLIRKRNAGDGACCHNKFRSSCPDSMGQSKFPVRLTSLWCTQTYRADSAGAARHSGHWQFSLQDFWPCSVKRRHRHRLQGSAGTSYLYSVYRFSLTHHGAGIRIKCSAAYYWKKDPPTFYQQTKSKSIIYIWQLAVKQKCLCLHTDFILLKFLLIPSRSKAPA